MQSDLQNLQVMKSILYGLMIAATALSLASCCGQPDLSGKWNILKVNGEEIVVIGEEAPYMEFNTEETRVHGYTGCNIMNGSYTMDKKDFAFGNMATTMMAGPEENMKAERNVLEAMGKVATVKADGEKLLLLDENKDVVMELGK